MAVVFKTKQISKYELFNDLIDGIYSYLKDKEELEDPKTYIKDLSKKIRLQFVLALYRKVYRKSPTSALYQYLKVRFE